MQREEMDSDLIGFKNNYPVMKKIRFEMGSEGKHIVLNSVSGKIFILNKKNVRIPVKVCGSVPENVRKVVLGRFPAKIQQEPDKEHVEAILTHDNNSYLNAKPVKDKATSLLQSGTSQGSGSSDSKTCTAVLKANRQDVQPCDMDKIKYFKEKINTTVEKTTDNSNKTSEKVIETTIESTETKESSPMDTLSHKVRLERKRKMRALSHQQTIKREVIKCLKQSMHGRLRNHVKTRSISCQTEIESRNSSCQTELQNNFEDLLEMLDDTKEPYAGNPLLLNSRKLMLELGSSPSPGHQVNEGSNSDWQSSFPASMGYNSMVNPIKQRFYNSLKNCDLVDPAGHIPLHIAVLNNNSIEVYNQCLMLKTRNISVDVPNNNGMTPLHLAVLNECDAKIVETLLENGADPLVKDSEGNSSLHNAIVFNTSKNILVVLLNTVKQSKETIDVFNYEGFTPLMLCVIENKYEMADECIAVDADPNTKDQKSGRTSLFHAVEKNNLKLVKLFMKNGANTKIKNFFGTSTHEATFELENINPEIKSLIIGKDTCPNRSKPSVSRRKKLHEKPVEHKKLKTVRILKIIEKEAKKG